MRNLASVQKVVAVETHPNADSLDIISILGWKVVCKRDEFKVGDLCIYFEIDSVLPAHEKYEFLRKSCYVKKDWLPLGEGFRLKTIKLRGQVSQGLVMPLFFSQSEDSWCIPFSWNCLPIKVNLGDDVTDLLGVVKWDPPVPAELAGQAKGNFPSFIRKTDQERVQNCYNDIPPGSYVMEEKLEGSSCTIYFNQGVFGICSRNLDLQISEENKDNSFIKTALQEGWDGALKHFGKNIAIQAELVGPGIQGNIYKLPSTKLYVFDVFDIDKQEYLTPAERTEVLDKIDSGGLFKFNRVPVVGNFVVYDETMMSSIESILDAADGRSELNMIQDREGLVFKSLSGRYSFKVISNKYLLRTRE